MPEKYEILDTEQVIKDFEKMTKNAKQVQLETLKKIMMKNGNVEYLKQFGYRGGFDPEEFKAIVPIVTDEDMEPYIERIADGDSSSSILTRDPFRQLSYSSGSSKGKPKHIPFTEELMDDTVLLYQIGFAFRNRVYPINGNGKALQFIYEGKTYKTKGGIPVASATTIIYQNPKFKPAISSIKGTCSSPQEVISGPVFEESLYCHLLCGLLFRHDIQYLFAVFAYNLVAPFRTFEQLWEEFVETIRTGVLNDRVKTVSVREAVSRLLKPNPEEAELIQTKILALDNWYGVIPALFPNAKYLYGIMTGAMEPYAKKLRHYGGDLPLVSHDYGSSEGWIGVNVDPILPPEQTVFTMIPSFGYYEFLPLNRSDEENKTVGLTEVRDGVEYEIILTNFTGFYRYNLGDVVRVQGFHNDTPKLKYIGRKTFIFGVNIDKTTETDVQQSVESAAKLLPQENLELIDFTCSLDMETEPGHYVLFWEISGDPTEELLQKCCDCLDMSFVGGVYYTCRQVKSVGPLELRVLGKGTFKKIMEHSVAAVGSVGQLKTPRYVKPTNKMLIKILSDNVVRKCFSKAYD